MAKGSNSPATIRNQNVESCRPVHGPNMSPESGGVSADHSHVESFHIRVIVSPSDVVSGDSYIWQGRTDDGLQTLEGATGCSKDSPEGATGYSKDLLSGATDLRKDSTHAHGLLTGLDSDSTSSLCLRQKKRPDLYHVQHSDEGHENKDILLPSASSWFQDTFQQSRLSGRELSPVRKSYSAAFSHEEKHHEKLALHKERYQEPKKKCSLLHVHHLEAVHPYTASYENLKKRVKEKYHPSVGKILFCQRFQGTCFAVGKHERRFIVTANHIFVGIGEHFKGEDLQLAIGSVVVQFENKENSVPTCYRLNPDMRCYSDSLDYIVVEMKPHERFCFPPPIQEFGHISHLIKDERVICIAFQSGKMVEDMTAALYVVNKIDRLDSMSYYFNPRELTDLKKDIFVHKKQIIATSMIYGSSGGIVVCVDSDLRARVIGMILKGYPREFYLTPPGQNNTTGCQLVEVMIPVEQIALDINREGNNMSRNFAKSIFGESQ